jgi:hypothetical protein
MDNQVRPRSPSQLKFAFVPRKRREMEIQSRMGVGCVPVPYLEQFCALHMATKSGLSGIQLRGFPPITARLQRGDASAND